MPTGLTAAHAEDAGLDPAHGISGRGKFPRVPVPEIPARFPGGDFAFAPCEKFRLGQKDIPALNGVDDPSASIITQTSKGFTATRWSARSFAARKPPFVIGSFPEVMTRSNSDARVNGNALIVPVP
ncbi:hypothetical protein [Parvibaculum sp.]|uniref:hypothetical protein n=1 Tax=Parvibaculum sp. TaxID=2024848 RepID=UPI001D82EBAB|nr:hypothetical protein [Parvibaculum sp.]MBX3490337.1 hypothetical protein [Parvibaculum sp.]